MTGRSIVPEQATQLGPGLILAGIGPGLPAPCAQLEVEVLAEVGRILLGHGFGPPLPALVGRLPVVESAIQADPAAGATLASTRGVPQGPQPTAPMAMTRHRASG
jgi:hypothetical protein